VRHGVADVWYGPCFLIGHLGGEVVGRFDLIWFPTICRNGSLAWGTATAVGGTRSRPSPLAAGFLSTAPFSTRPSRGGRAARPDGAAFGGTFSPSAETFQPAGLRRRV